MPKIIFILLTSIFPLLAYSQNESIDALCPIKRFVKNLSPQEFADKFQGDSLILTVPNSENKNFESFKLLTPDTIWLKEKPKNKLPLENKHYKLISNYASISGWGVNAHRQYTPGRALEHTLFILRGNYTEVIPYLGTINYVILEDKTTGQLIKWDYSQNENKGIVISSPSIMRHLSLMKGLDFIIEESDSTFIDGKCLEVSFSIMINPKIWNFSLDTKFKTSNGYRNSHNWEPRFFLKKDEEKIIRLK